MRVMMIGPFPRSPDRIDGGVAAATMYLCQALAVEPDMELIGVRICNGNGARWRGPRLGVARRGSAARQREPEHALPAAEAAFPRVARASIVRISSTRRVPTSRACSRPAAGCRPS